MSTVIGRPGFLNTFSKLPNLTKYHHFSIDSRYPGVVIVKESIESGEEEYKLLTVKFPFNRKKPPLRLL